MSRREKEGDSRREKRVGWRRKAERGGVGRRGQLREDGGGRRSEEGPAGGQWREDGGGRRSEEGSGGATSGGRTEAEGGARRDRPVASGEGGRRRRPVPSPARRWR